MAALTEDEIRKQVTEFVIKTIDNYLAAGSTTTADDALHDIATMIEVRGLHVFENMLRHPLP